MDWRLAWLAAGWLLAGTGSLLAQAPESASAAAQPYAAVAVQLPEPFKNADFEAFRQRLTRAAAAKDRAALAQLVIASGFFWQREDGDGADPEKSGADNLAAALGLWDRDGAGWNVLASYAGDPTAQPSPEHKGAICAPADPIFRDRDLLDVVKATSTEVTDWAYPLTADVAVRSEPQSTAPAIETLGLYFVRTLPDGDMSSAGTGMLKIVAPSGRSGYVPAQSIALLGNDQLCYVQNDDGWKVGGYIGAGSTP